MNRNSVINPRRAHRATRQFMLLPVLAALLSSPHFQAHADQSGRSKVEGPSAAGLPFKAVYTTTSTARPADPGSRCSELITAVEGSGLATQLGKFTTVQSSCLIPSQDPTAVRDGEFTLTAEDGASLRGHYGGRVIPTPTSNQDQQYLVEVAWSLAGGTGRFQGAKGGGLGTGLLNPNTGDANIVLDGNIRLPSRPGP